MTLSRRSTPSLVVVTTILAGARRSSSGSTCRSARRGRNCAGPALLRHRLKMSCSMDVLLVSLPYGGAGRLFPVTAFFTLHPTKLGGQEKRPRPGNTFFPPSAREEQVA